MGTTQGVQSHEAGGRRPTDTRGKFGGCLVVEPRIEGDVPAYSRLTAQYEGACPRSGHTLPVH